MIILQKVFTKTKVEIINQLLIMFLMSDLNLHQSNQYITIIQPVSNNNLTHI
jgi:hypothetical protein